jgi:hypothetical protein|tara:strand:+ start:664 stop:963 length:300 start_codon:yes stop_codon:yes gene_type:complete
MKENQKRITEESWSEVGETARTDFVNRTEPLANSEDQPGQTEVADNNWGAKDAQVLGRDTDYSENSTAYPPEVLRLLDVICEIIMGAASVDTSRTNEPQ